MTILVAVIMSLKGAALAKAELHEIMGIDQLYGLRVRAIVSKGFSRKASSS
jgi:hypothetical protein